MNSISICEKSSFCSFGIGGVCCEIYAFSLVWVIQPLDKVSMAHLFPCCFLFGQRCLGPDRLPRDAWWTCENPSSCSPCWYVFANASFTLKEGREGEKEKLIDAFFKGCVEEPSNESRFAPGTEGEVKSHGVEKCRVAELPPCCYAVISAVSRALSPGL